MEKLHAQQNYCLPENTEDRLLGTKEWNYLKVTYQTTTARMF